MIKVADLGKAPLEDAVDVIRAGRRFRRRQLFQIRLFGNSPIKHHRRAAGHGFGHGQRPQRERQHAAGEGVGDMPGRENVGGTREDEQSATVRT